MTDYASDERRARETVEAIDRNGGHALAVQADVAKIADLDRLFANAPERFVRLDLLVEH